jgi:hypothetical protein
MYITESKCWNCGQEVKRRYTTYLGYLCVRCYEERKKKRKVNECKPTIKQLTKIDKILSCKEARNCKSYYPYKCLKCIESNIKKETDAV